MGSSGAAAGFEPIATFESTVTIDVYPADFEAFSFIGALDLTKLSQGEHRIQIGRIRDDCCSHVVTARIIDGNVVGVEAQMDTEAAEGARNDFSDLFREALERLEPYAEPQPVPVALFFSRLNVGMPPPIGVSGCIRICFFDYCVTCCTSPAGGTSCTFSGPGPLAPRAPE